MIPRIRHGFQRISRFFRSIRFRLSMWFALVLAVILLVFSTLVYYRQATSLREQAAARVNLRLRDLDSNLRRSLREDESGGWLQVPGTTPGSRFVLQTYEILILADDAGMPARSWGLILADEVVDLSALAPNREGGKMFTVRLKSIPLSEELQDEFEAWSSQLGESSLQEKNEIPPREYLFITAPVGYEDRLLGWVIFGQPVDPEGQLPRLRITLGLAGGLTLLGALLGSYWLAYRALSPVHAITRTAREINDTDLSRRLNIRSHDELGELAGTFDNMLDRLESAFNRQRRFTADASHELRTPLTIIGLETSRALEPGRSLSDVQQSLQVIQSENEFMSRLVNELLTLARMDSGQVQLQHDSSTWATWRLKWSSALLPWRSAKTSASKQATCLRSGSQATASTWESRSAI